MALKDEMLADHDEIVAEHGTAMRWNGNVYSCHVGGTRNELGIELGAKQRRFYYTVTVRIDAFATGADGNVGVNDTPKEGDEVTLINQEFETEEKAGKVVERSRDSVGAIMQLVIETKEM